MSFPKGKQKYSREEIVDILRRNSTLYKDDEVFVQYILDLATFLLEYRDHQRKVLEHQAPKPGSTTEERAQWLSRTKERDQKVYASTRHHSSSELEGICRTCGGPTMGQMMCPNCGHMTA